MVGTILGGGYQIDERSPGGAWGMDVCGHATLGLALEHIADRLRSGICDAARIVQPGGSVIDWPTVQQKLAEMKDQRSRQ